MPSHVVKIPFEPLHGFTLELRQGYRILHFAVQDEEPRLWVLQDTKEAPVTVTFNLRRDYDPVYHKGMHHVGTSFDADGAAWHLFKEVGA